MAVYLNNPPPSKDLKIAVEELGGEVRLVFDGHPFVRCYTDHKGNHIVEVKDVDASVPVTRLEIPILCWRR
jgi:hypothetical protein